ncbi:hypothetical protein [Pedobacter sp. SL55]|uniref:hypothetical protein n=1 Tax=Pedobacter sp. SL55 TaxID=2995161 RepID=UPI0022708E4E|nr:hypothetical protein [Pedobacter sp. SL55]WAC40327.1 hypothetical protein OVA16_17400 [Pedobacter sp. SL55]
MLLEVDDLKWTEFISIYVEKSLFVNPAWLAISASSFKFGLKYYIWKQDGTEIIGFPIFYRGSTIKAPTNFHTFSLVRAQGTQEQQKTAFVNALQQLKHQFKVVKLKTEIDFPYLKEFESVGFSITEKFTYLKKLDELNYARNISRMLKRSSQKKYTISLSGSFSNAFSKIWSSNKRYLFGNQKSFFNFFLSFSRRCFLASF